MKIFGMSLMNDAEVYIRCPHNDSGSQGLIRSAEKTTRTASCSILLTT